MQRQRERKTAQGSGASLVSRDAGKLAVAGSDPLPRHQVHARATEAQAHHMYVYTAADQW